MIVAIYKDTLVTEAQLPEIDLQEFGVVQLVDVCGGAKRMPKLKLVKGRVFTSPGSARKRLCVQVSDVDDLEIMRRVFIALSVSKIPA